MMKIELSDIQIEKIIKRLDEAVAVSTLLENDLGTQRDISSANAVCVIKELIIDAKDMIESAVEKQRSD